MKIEKDGNDSLSIEHKEEIHIFHKSTDLLIGDILNNNKGGRIKEEAEDRNRWKRQIIT